MGSAGRTCSFLPTLRGRDSRLEIAKRCSERAARLLGQPFVLATDQACTHGTRGAKCAARRAQGLVFVSAQLFAGMADDFGWRSRFDADGFRRLDLFSSANSENRSSRRKQIGRAHV